MPSPADEALTKVLLTLAAVHGTNAKLIAALVKLQAGSRSEARAALDDAMSQFDKAGAELEAAMAAVTGLIS